MSVQISLTCDSDVFTESNFLLLSEHPDSPDVGNSLTAASPDLTEFSYQFELNH